MKVQFKQAVHLTNVDGSKGKSYSRGIHEVPREHLEHSFFQKLVNAGLAVDAEDTSLVTAETLYDRQKRLSEKLKLAGSPKGSLDHAQAVPGESIGQAAGDGKDVLQVSEPSPVAELPVLEEPPVVDEPSDDADAFEPPAEADADLHEEQPKAAAKKHHKKHAKKG